MTSLPGRTANFVRVQARATGTQEVSEGAVACHAMLPRVVSGKTVSYRFFFENVQVAIWGLRCPGRSNMKAAVLHNFGRR